MRLNVSSEELTAETQVVWKTADNGKKYVGLRVFLDSPDSLNMDEEGRFDDRSAVTFWIDKGDELAWARAEQMLLCALDDLVTAKGMGN